MSAVVSIRQLSGEVRTNPLMRREAYSMSLYVAIILLSVLWVFDDDHPPAEFEVFLVEAGATVGLVLAHGFASWVSTRIIGDVAEEVDPGDLLLVQIGGALAVAGVSMLAMLVAPLARAPGGAVHGGRVDRGDGVPRDPFEPFDDTRIRVRPVGPGGRRVRGIHQGVPVPLIGRQPARGWVARNVHDARLES